MKYVTENTRLTDSLERELINAAIEEQFQVRPGKALKAYFSELFRKLGRKDDVSGKTAESLS